jgi:OOP family OmpA-OmpF porin
VSVSFAVDGDRIVVHGSAPSLWLEKARGAARMLPTGAPVLDLAAVQSVSDGAIGNLRDRIQARTIRFNANEPLPAPGQQDLLDEVAAEVNGLAALSSILHVAARVTLTGHADGVGQGTQNLSLSLARAEAVRALLKKRGVNPDLLSVRGAGALEPVQAESSEAARSANRRVSFTVGLEELP